MNCRASKFSVSGSNLGLDFFLELHYNNNGSKLEPLLTS